LSTVEHQRLSTIQRTKRRLYRAYLPVITRTRR
jgi:hypothetical protein